MVNQQQGSTGWQVLFPFGPKPEPDHKQQLTDTLNETTRPSFSASGEAEEAWNGRRLVEPGWEYWSTSEVSGRRKQRIRQGEAARAGDGPGEDDPLVSVAGRGLAIIGAARPTFPEGTPLGAFAIEQRAEGATVLSVLRATAGTTPVGASRSAGPSKRSGPFEHLLSIPEQRPSIVCSSWMSGSCSSDMARN